MFYKILVFQMLYSIEDREELQKLNELVSLENQVKVARLQDKLGKQNSHEDIKKVFEPVTKSLASTTEDITKTITEAYIKNNQEIKSLNNKLLKIMNDRGIMASLMLSLLSKIANLENTTQLKVVKNSNSNRVKNLLIPNSIPITSHDNLFTFRDIGKIFELKGYLLKMITNKDYMLILQVYRTKN